MFGWLTDRRRKRLEEAPFPAGWQAHLDDNVRAVRKRRVALRAFGAGDSEIASPWPTRDSEIAAP